jgi:predicted DNA-binding mobile mystery protein A
MKKARLAAQSRSHLDERFKALGPVTRYSSPVRGWIKAVREALGMTTAQLAKRLGMKQPSVVAIEQSEAKGTIELSTLRRGRSARLHPRLCARAK